MRSVGIMIRRILFRTERSCSNLLRQLADYIVMDYVRNDARFFWNTILGSTYIILSELGIIG